MRLKPSEGGSFIHAAEPKVALLERGCLLTESPLTLEWACALEVCTKNISSLDIVTSLFIKLIKYSIEVVHTNDCGKMHNSTNSGPTSRTWLLVEPMEVWNGLHSL
jgi:hypothetical protein